MLKIRLQRVGRRNDPSYRLVVAPSTIGPKSGNFLERLGFYNPVRKVRKINAERAKYWISCGAQLSGTVHNLLVSEGIIEGKKKNVLPKKSPILKELTEEEKNAKAQTATESPPTGINASSDEVMTQGDSSEVSKDVQEK